MCGAVAIFARVFDVDRDAGEVFDHDLRRETRVTTRATGSDDDAVALLQSGFDRAQTVTENYATAYMMTDCRGDGVRLLVDFLQHAMRKPDGRTGGRLIHV